MSQAVAFAKSNESYVKAFTQGDLALPPSKAVAVVVCMDARIDPAAALGIDLGSTHVIRNAGGRTSDALRSLIISQQLLGTREIVIIHHTDCGMLTFTDVELRDKIHKELYVHADHIAFLPFSDIEKSVRDDIAFVKASPYILEESKSKITGYVYDVKNGKITEVKA
ncbi:carbonic anhydrase [Mrakia frigida]|uniref:beta-class carbonic anhydrase n=1 Tax=Mrakia frigida TaxID=29902 RepID=UPI003FCBEF47